MRLTNTNGNYALHFMVNDAADSLGYGLAGLSAIRTASSEHFAIVTGGASPTPRLVVRESGGIGISTTVPTAKLHVHDGDIRISTTAGGASRGIVFQDGTTQNTAAGGSGLLRQSISSGTTAYFPVNSIAIPYDDTISQIGEGNQVLVATITPVNGANTLEIDVIVQLCEPSNVCDQVTVSVLKDADANAICVMGEERGVTSGLRGVQLKCKVAAGSTTPRNYSVRYGGNTTNCIDVNGCSSRKYGGSLTSGIYIKEIAP